ncbi:hypothetical protein ACFVT8_00655 [Lysinibacillus sp. NPDC058147]|uniref:hypothetical protein n=1 Tax=unclassified Lysinibacillus TaxID=2636778 RepID=UPI0036D9CDD1
MWKPTSDEINGIIVLNGDKATTKRVDHYTALVPVLYDVGCTWTNNIFDMSEDAERQKQSAMKLFIAKACQYFELKIGLVSRSMGTVAYSYSDEIPATVYKPLKPYRKLRW